MNREHLLLAFFSFVIIYIFYSTLPYTYRAFSSRAVDWQVRPTGKFVEIIREGPDSDALTTVVSQYFALKKSKHSQSSYNAWIINLLKSVESPLVIFTDNSSLSFLREHRNASTFRTYYVLYGSIWDVMREMEIKRDMVYIEKYEKQQQPLDPEQRIHNPNLYAIWNSKAYMTSKVADFNPYNSQFFIYTDAGAWRDRTIPNWPDDAFVQKLTNVLQDRMFLGQISPMNSIDFSVKKDYIEGTFFAGSKAAILNYHDEFYELHDDWLKQGRFIGKDQTMMNHLAFVTYKDRVVRLRAWDTVCCDPWFFYQRFFASDDFYQCPEKNRLSLLIEPISKSSAILSSRANYFVMFSFIFSLLFVRLL